MTQSSSVKNPLFTTVTKPIPVLWNNKTSTDQRSWKLKSYALLIYKYVLDYDAVQCVRTRKDTD